MSDKINLLEEEIKSRMLGYEVKPPVEVWSGIVKERSFGHKVCNRILQSHYYLSLLILMLLSLAYFVVPDKALVAMYTPITQKKVLLNSSSYEKVETNDFIKNEQKQGKAHKTSLNKQNNKIPHQDETASNTNSTQISASSFTDPLLNRILSNSKSIPIVAEFEMIHYKHLQKLMPKKLKTIKDTKQSINRIDKILILPQQEIKQNRWFLLIMAGPEFISKSFQLEYYISQQYVEKRKNNLRSRQAYTFSSRLNYKIKKRAFLEMGIDYSKIEETSFIVDNLFNSEFSFLSLPLLIGHESSKGRIGWEIKGGLSYQIYNSYKGKILAADGVKAWNLSDPSENPYKLSGVVNLHLAGAVSYMYSERMKLIMQPYYKRSLNSVSKNTTAFKEKFNYMGLKLGVEFDL